MTKPITIAMTTKARNAHLATSFISIYTTELPICSSMYYKFFAICRVLFGLSATEGCS
jgi:hypothetical protein